MLQSIPQAEQKYYVLIDGLALHVRACWVPKPFVVHSPEYWAGCLSRYYAHSTLLVRSQLSVSIQLYIGLIHVISPYVLKVCTWPVRSFVSSVTIFGFQCFLKIFRCSPNHSYIPLSFCNEIVSLLLSPPLCQICNQTHMDGSFDLGQINEFSSRLVATHLLAKPSPSSHSVGLKRTFWSKQVLLACSSFLYGAFLSGGKGKE